MRRATDFILGVTIPDPAKNVGVHVGVTRTAYSGPTTITTDGTIVQNKNVTQYIDVDAANVTFINCYFSAGGALDTGGLVNCKTANCSNIRFFRCTFKPSTMSDRRDAVYGHHYTAERCHIERTVDGFAVANQFSSNNDVHILGNWIGNLSWYENDKHADNSGHNDGTHNDGVQVHSGTNTWIIGNAFYGYKYNALGTPALDSSADNLYPQIGQIVIAQSTAYFHVSNLHVNRNFVWGGANGFKFTSTCGIHGTPDAPYDADCQNNIWMDDNQRDYGFTWHYYLIRTDDNMTIDGGGPYAAGGVTTDTHGNHWSADSVDVNVGKRGDPVFIRVDVAA